MLWLAAFVIWSALTNKQSAPEKHKTEKHKPQKSWKNAYCKQKLARNLREPEQFDIH